MAQVNNLPADFKALNFRTWMVVFFLEHELLVLIIFLSKILHLIYTLITSYLSIELYILSIELYMSNFYEKMVKIFFFYRNISGPSWPM